jgi:hypothetical protein
MMRAGYYDESLALTRNAGEVANLLQLFASEPESLRRWKSLSGRERWSDFRPKRVRDALASSGDLLITEERYSRLSEIATHATPETRPQAHNPLARPSQAPVFQAAGALVALNEAALAAAVLTIPATALIDVGTARRLKILEAARSLAEQLGGANLLEIDEYYEGVRRRLGAA